MVMKLLFTVAAIVIVWTGFRWLSRAQARRKVEDERRMRGDGTARRGAPRKAVEDMTACPACGTYVAGETARSCGRDDCPYPG